MAGLTDVTVQRVILIAVFAFILGSWLVVAHRKLRGTTLRVPLYWTGISLATILVVEQLVVHLPPSTAENWRCFAALGTVCPAMALLGAKQPQDKGWQFVVLTLWLILALPVAQSLVFSPHAPLELHAAWRFFLWLLVGFGVANYLPTRFAGPALTAGLAQLILLHPVTHFPWSGSPESAIVWSLGFLAGAFSWAGCVARQPRSHENAADRVWLDFRNAYGAVWALRVKERANSAFRQAGRDEQLHWQGFTPGWDPWHVATSDSSDSVHVTLQMLLRRFVSAEWILQRRTAVRSSSPDRS